MNTLLGVLVVFALLFCLFVLGRKLWLLLTRQRWQF